MQIAAIENANKTVNKLTDIGDIIKGLIDSGKAIIENKQAPKRKSPRNPRNPRNGRPNKLKNDFFCINDNLVIKIYINIL